ncbi:annulin-like [Anopheles ziemanni]|uniref:annulin-like n=1 Tax=Anopheles coustani TaxID=139045 RepID=UPI00265B306E|nr:annulin-like [Anopheles coustani]XP_058177071.1 annulin-like [Anopheles ziemanni]
MEVTAPHELPFAFWPGNNELENELENREGELKIERIDTCVEENGTQHHTDKFEMMGTPRGNGMPSQLVVRRGQEFLLKFHCNRPINPEVDAVSLVLAVDSIRGEYICHGHGTVVFMTLQSDDGVTEEDQDMDWTATLQASQTLENGLTEITVAIKTSPNASVSRWHMIVNVKSKGFDEVRYSLGQTFYLLFNPWCPEDPVFLDDENQRQEYVLEDMTMIWKGSARNFNSYKWKLGQYEENVLDCSLWLLGDVARVSATYRGNPVKVCRALSGVVNSNDNYGVLLGNWSGDYRGGTAPSAWTGSVKILQKFYQQKELDPVDRNPILYGQCFAFAGVLGTLCRALGIPCRIVTNFTSAHDTEGSMTIDKYVDEEGNNKKEFSGDSVWNFHVWNEVWLKRHDLDSEMYDGWQVIDGTPQESSDGIYKLGPAPVLAIKNGRVNMLYDCDFVFSEVNADSVVWRYRGPGKSLELVRMNTTEIGRFISTKAVGVDEREDITKNYKCGEQSTEEKQTMLRALKLGKSCLTKHYLKLARGKDQSNAKNDDVKFELQLNDYARFGESFTVLLLIRNISDDQVHSIKGRINLDHIVYTGKHIKSIASHPFSITIEPNGEEVIQVPIVFDDYYEPGMDEAIFKVSSFAAVEGTDHGYYSQKDYSLRKPTVHLQLASDPILRSSLKITAAFRNPLPVPITDGLFHIECSGLCKSLSIPADPIDARGNCEVVFMIIPSAEGTTQITAKFISQELSDVVGSLTFEVSLPNENNSLNEVLYFS